MRRRLRQIIPSMFHRRLILLLVVLTTPALALTARLSQLTILQHDRLAADAEAKLVRRAWTPAARGRILDRKGRVLARDQATFRVMVQYGVLAGTWAERQAPALARRAEGVDWAALPGDARAALEAATLEALRAHVSAMWDRLARATGRTPEALRERARAIVARVERMHGRLESVRTDTAIDRRRARGERLDAEALAAIEARAAQPIAEQVGRHPLAETAGDRAGFDLMRLAQRRVALRVNGPTGPVFLTGVPALPGVVIDDSADRVYPFDRVEIELDARTLPGPLRARDGDEPVRTIAVRGPASHLLGTVRDTVYREDIAARDEALRAEPALEARAITPSGEDRGAYRASDRVGATGLESAHEHTLRGLRGLRRTRLDTGAVETTAPDDGLDVRLTIDAMLQARIAAALEPGLGLTRAQPWHGSSAQPEGTALAASVVVLDARTSEVLAMVSTPRPVRGEAEPSERVYPAFIDPYVNRSVSVPYPPGSIAKALVGAEALRTGALPPGGGVECTGYLIDGRPDMFRCWIFKRHPGVTHSPRGERLGVAEGLKLSCNIVFYTLGERLGAGGIRAMYERFGVGEGFGFGVGPEWPGSIGRGSAPLSVGESRLLGIGQGPVNWTPVHAANAYAALARGGGFVEPTLVLSDGLDEGPAGHAGRELGYGPAVIAEVLEGLRLVSSDPEGTGHAITFGTGVEPIFNAPGLEIRGKTGTAAAPPTLDDTGAVVRRGDHAWYVCLARPAGDRGPGYAIAVIVEYGGSGGRAAGPIANQAVHALAAEGYLPGGPGPTGTGASARAD